MLLTGILCFAVLIAGCSSARISRVEKSVATQNEYTKELMSVADNTSKTINESATRIADLETRLAQIQTELKTVQTDDNATIREMKDNISFLNDQLARIDKSVQTTGRPVQQAPQGANVFRPSGFNVNTAYDAALADYQSKKYETAISGFKEILTVAPTSTLADNAQYWIGESYYAMGNYEQSLAALNKVLDYPQSNKIPDARVKSAMINQRLGKNDLAREEFRAVLAGFPGTDAANLASKHLSALGQ